MSAGRVSPPENRTWASGYDDPQARIDEAVALLDNDEACSCQECLRGALTGKRTRSDEEQP